MNLRQFRPYLERDLYCPHCAETEDLVPHHRKNRGAGGSKLPDRPSNILVVCSTYNMLMESDAKVAELARLWGHKLRRGDDPALVPVFERMTSSWWLLDDEFRRVRTDSPDGKPKYSF